MKANNAFTWDAPQLSPEDEKLIDAYQRIGRSIDDLPYTKEYEELVSSLSPNPDDAQKHAVFKRLLTLRKNGRLPRIASLAI